MLCASLNPQHVCRVLLPMPRPQHPRASLWLLAALLLHIPWATWHYHNAMITMTPAQAVDALLNFETVALFNNRGLEVGQVSRKGVWGTRGVQPLGLKGAGGWAGEVKGRG